MTLVSLNIGLYLLSALFLLAHLFKKGQKWWLPLSYISIFSALGLHAISLSYQLSIGDLEVISAIEALSLASIMMVLLIIPYLKRHLNTAIAIMLFAGATQILTLFDHQDVGFSTPSPWLSLHILTSIIAYAILLLASVQALLLYLRDRALKNRRSITQKFPPILRMELLLFRMLTIGFILLTVSLVTSFAFFDQWFSPHFIHKTVLTGLAWILYGAILWAHHYYGLRGRPAAKFILLTAVILLLGITGTRLIQEFLFAS